MTKAFQTLSTTITRICDAIERLANIVLVIQLSSLIIVVFLQVVSRHFMERPWLWTVDLGIFFLAWSTFLAAGVCVRHNAHFVIDLWPTKWKFFGKVLSWISIVSIGVLSYFLLVLGLDYAMVGFNRIAGMTNIPMFYFILSIPVGAVLIMLFTLEKGLLLLNDKKGDES